jgi:hypothetical protein
VTDRDPLPDGVKAEVAFVGGPGAGRLRGFLIGSRRPAEGLAVEHPAVHIGGTDFMAVHPAFGKQAIEEHLLPSARAALDKLAW